MSFCWPISLFELIHCLIAFVLIKSSSFKWAKLDIIISFRFEGTLALKIFAHKK